MEHPRVAIRFVASTVLPQPGARTGRRRRVRGTHGGRMLRIIEFAAKFELDRIAIDAFVAQIELDAELPNQGTNVV